MNSSYQSILSVGVEKKYRELENRIMQDVVRRILKSKEITSTADWQINRFHILGNSTKNIEDIIRSTVGNDYPDTFELYDRVIEQEYTRSKELYEQVNEIFIPYEQNPELQQITDALINQSNEELFNITKSMGFKVSDGHGGTVFWPLAEYYNKFLDDAMIDIVSGAFDYNSVLRRTVSQMTNSGLRTVDYASGHTNRCDVAARRAVMTGLSQLTGKISDMNAQRLHTDYFEIDWHSGARPSHRVWQGKVYSKEELVTVCGLGTGPGLLGWNCYHEYYAFIPGISERNYTDEWLSEQNRKEDIPKRFRGKEYTLYEATQKQRSMETAMRAQRQKVRLLQQGKADPDDITIEKCKYQAQLDEYREFSKVMNLRMQRERIYYDLQSRVAPSRETYEKWKIEQIAKKAENRISEEERIKNELLSRQYKKLSLEEFKKMHHTVSKEERKILYGRSHLSGYINSSNARKLNKLLREDSDLPKEYQEISNALSEVIKKNTVQEDIIVTRYVSTDALKSIAGIEFPKSPGLLSSKKDIEKYWTNIDNLKDGIKAGHTYVEKGFLSTSGVFDKNVMSKKEIRFEIKVPKGANAYITTNDRESEIIFGVGTKLEIINVNVENNRTANFKIILECLMR